MRRDQRRRSRVRKAGLIGALAATMVVGSVGLAAADTLPDPVQQAAHDALGKVGVNVPPGQDRYNDPTACPGGPYRNHGAYVRAHKNDPNAAQSPCGKPNVSMHDKSGAGEAGDGESDDTQSQHGPPPWAHAHGNGKGDGADSGEGKGKGGQHGNGHATGQGQDEQGDGSDADSSSPNSGTPDTAPTTFAPAPTVPPTTAPAPITTTTLAPTTTTTTSVPEEAPTP
jgi:hypothetical protein